MGRAHKKVSYRPDGKPWTVEDATAGTYQGIRYINGRWKLRILFQLFDGGVLRFSELERAIPEVTQKVLAEQLRQLEADGIVLRTIYPEVPPRVEYQLTAWGESLCPALDALLSWAATKPGEPGLNT